MDVPVRLEKLHAIEKIADWKPDIVAISLTTVSFDRSTNFWAELRKRLGSKVFFLAGGPLATHLGSGLLKLPGWSFLDGIVREEGEVPILRLAEAIKFRMSFDQVPNLAYHTNNGIKENDIEHSVQNLDQLPFPSRDQFEQNSTPLPFLRISTSRGCTSHCTFCNAPHARNRVGPAVKVWRGATPNCIVNEIENLVSRYGVNTFEFVDSTFEDPGGGELGKTRVRAIANEILKRNLKIYFNVFMQAQNWKQDDLPLITLLYKAGLEKAFIGIESGSNLGLQCWEKKATVEDNRQIIRLLHRSHIYVVFGFISFHPWSTFQEIRENHSFLFHENIGHTLRYFTGLLELYPGATIINRLRQENLLLPKFDVQPQPFAYHFIDERVAQLVNYLNILYGNDYSNDHQLIKEPSVFQFEKYDLSFIKFLGRLRRTLNNDVSTIEILDESYDSIFTFRRNMSKFNYELTAELVDLAEAGRLRKEDVERWVKPIEDFFSRKHSEIKKLKLQTASKLQRNGCKLKGCQSILESVNP